MTARIVPGWLNALAAVLLSTLTAAATAQAPAAAPSIISGAGATFPAPLYAAWALEYRGTASVELHYAAVGSGLGVERIQHGEVDFGASDAPLTREQLEAAGLMQFPAVIGGILPVINISGIRPGELKLTGAVLAQIYLGLIRRWNDPAITSLNPALHLPSSHITVVHRDDASGSSLMWTAYLAATSPEWRSQVGASTAPAWPTGVGANGNEGVASYVDRTRYAIGYVEYYFARAHGLSDVALSNHDGRVVRARPDNFAAASVNQGWQSLLSNQQLPPDAPGALSWPMTGASFILLPRHPADAGRARAVLQFFDWALHKGTHSVDQLEYAPLPPQLIEQLPQLWQSVHDDAGRSLWP